MGKRQDWCITTCVFLFLSLSSQIQSTTQTHFLTRLYDSIRGVGSSDDTRHINAIRRIDMPSLQTTKSGVKNLKDKDLIKRLFGQPSVNFKQYGGYVTVNETARRHLFYYFVEAINANASTPLLLWFNGGPGCSSLHGAFLEHGPFRVHSDGKTLYNNPYSWNNVANVLYVESPAQVGFSYTETPPAENKQGDGRTSKENYEFLVKWLERFPEYKGREFYVAGQSYAGHYCPQLAQIILQRNNQTFINLRGVFIGNPGLNADAEAKGEYEYLLGHGIISQEYFENKNRLCEDGKYSMDCVKEMVKIKKQMENIDNYSIYAPMCLNSTLTSKPKKYTTVLKFDPCSAHYMTAYLNNAKAQKAMNVKTTTKWKKCHDSNVNWNESDYALSMIPILEELIGKGVRVWVYSGDSDAVISVKSTMDVLKTMNLTVVKPWRSWASEGEVGGYIEEYKNNFTFATVRGAGHSVPSDQPIRALTLFTSFIRNVPLLGFTSKFFG